METNQFNFAAIKEQVVQQVTDYGFNILGALAVVLVGWWMARLVRSGTYALLTKRRVEPTIVTFVRNLLYIVLMAFVFIAALGLAGVQTASFVAVIGAAGLAVGLALQGSLANFAAGFLLIIFRPFKKGDYVEAGGTAGIVDEISVFTTVLTTPDNKLVIVPNAKISGDNIINYSALMKRRLDLVFGVSYGDNVAQVKEILHRVATADTRIHKDPAPLVVMSALADSSVNFILRVWVNVSDYWGVNFDTIEKVKLTFDAEGVTIPFPQRDVHMHAKKE